MGINITDNNHGDIDKDEFPNNKPKHKIINF